jgi:hypothetical protein
MLLTLKCKYCNRKFPGHREVIKINGTAVDLKCPYCNKHTIDNLSKFCEDQIGTIDNRLYRTRLMIELSNKICKLVNNDRGN